MGNKEKANGNAGAKIGALNEIFEDVISDATDLIKDLYWGVKTYLFFGLISILFGLSEILKTLIQSKSGITCQFLLQEH